MSKIKLYLFVMVGIFVSGCTNPNVLSIGTIQDEKNVQYRESEYAEILIEKDIAASSDEDMKKKLLFMTQECVKGYTMKSEYVYYNEKYSTNSWFEISDDKINIENNVRNIIKNKDDLKSEVLNLGGKQGNRMFKISLPYKLTKINSSTYKLTIYNNENIKVVESINNSTGKPYETTVYNFNINDFKVKINRMARCI